MGLIFECLEGDKIVQEEGPRLRHVAEGKPGVECV